ncbi:hypothetical protein [Streptococcus oralis]|jgi:hypothetical protein|uniref:hypothetical protein n=1 Tax=Streptococcus oralis TaxID=1303 RepID=UPI000AE16ED8|nr:hypothetical protein [Streptococcus oralis]
MNETLKSNHQNFEIIKKNISNFELFNTEEAKKETDIFKIPSPFEYALPRLIEEKTSINYTEMLDTVGKPLFNFANENKKRFEHILDKNTGDLFKLDFESLSSDVKEKLRKGIYQIGESRKVDGNYRAVIIDTTKNNVRVEDVTLQRVNATEGMPDTDIASQVYLKEIHDLLLDIKDNQDFQIKWDRNNSILPPFFSARTKVLEAQNSIYLDEKIKLLNQANSCMEESVSAIKADLISNKEEIIKRTSQFNYSNNSIKQHANFILNDTEIMTKIIGMQVYIDLTLDNQAMANDRLLAYQGSMELLTQKDILENQNLLIKLAQYISPQNQSIPNRISLLELIHDNYQYEKNNTDLFLNLQNKLNEATKMDSIRLADSENLKLETGNNNDS